MSTYILGRHIFARSFKLTFDHTYAYMLHICDSISEKRTTDEHVFVSIVSDFRRMSVTPKKEGRQMTRAAK